MGPKAVSIKGKKEQNHLRGWQKKAGETRPVSSHRRPGPTEGKGLRRSWKVPPSNRAGALYLESVEGDPKDGNPLIVRRVARPSAARFAVGAKGDRGGNLRLGRPRRGLLILATREPSS